MHTHDAQPSLNPRRVVLIPRGPRELGHHRPRPRLGRTDHRRGSVCGRGVSVFNLVGVSMRAYLYLVKLCIIPDMEPCGQSPRRVALKLTLS